MAKVQYYCAATLDGYIEGKPLFERPLPHPLRLMGTRAFASGMVELRYGARP